MMWSTDNQSRRFALLWYFRKTFKNESNMMRLLLIQQHLFPASQLKSLLVACSVRSSSFCSLIFALPLCAKKTLSSYESCTCSADINAAHASGTHSPILTLLGKTGALYLYTYSHSWMSFIQSEVLKWGPVSGSLVQSELSLSIDLSIVTDDQHCQKQPWDSVPHNLTLMAAILVKVMW